ncbi:hypothetical protein PanWU01x14_124540 [Parasponia andersonii]|uniref:Uncharacterized protein n=1 Tax=Parasponia andersonii TaxID=3476 RepID=A0A2P5CTL7_PARAD|nr:hypothetical protein PanWU01x14_124540 [Parasponia andersonii]
MFSKCQVQKNCIRKLGLRKNLQDYFYFRNFNKNSNSTSQSLFHFKIVKVFSYTCVIYLCYKKEGKKDFETQLSLVLEVKFVTIIPNICFKCLNPNQPFYLLSSRQGDQC